MRMVAPSLEFLIVCRDAAAHTTILNAIGKDHVFVNSTSTAIAALAYIKRRKLDAIFLDTSVTGALSLIPEIRQGGSNKSSVIFGCASPTENSRQLFKAGVNFVLYKPLFFEAVNESLKTAAPIMQKEHERYMRHKLVLPIVLKDPQARVAMAANISTGGLGIRSQHPYKPGSTVEFSLKLPTGELSGAGEIAWTNSKGCLGIKFRSLEEHGKHSLTSWLEQHKEKPGLDAD